MKLTDSAFRSAKAPAKGCAMIWDSEVPGFGLRIMSPSALNPGGARVFFLTYRINRRQVRHTIGPVGSWDVKQARAEAASLRRLIDKGQDPAADRREARDAPTMRDLAERYRVERLPGKAERSRASNMRVIESRILPELGGRKVADVHSGDVRALHRAISASGAPVGANRVIGLLSSMFSLSLQPKAGDAKPWRDAAQGNPCQHVERNPETGRERFFSPVELVAIGDALALSDSPEADCLRLLMLTGARPGEAMGATWADFAEPGIWDKPGATTKQRKRHRVPLGAAAVELVERLRAARKPGGLYVFARSRSRPIADLRATWRRATDAATLALWANAADSAVVGLVADLGAGATVATIKAEATRRGLTLPAAPAGTRPYDLRHSFASAGAAGGISLQIIGALLGHSSTKTTTRYAHLADDPLRAATARIGASITGASPPADNIEPFGRRRA